MKILMIAAAWLLLLLGLLSWATPVPGGTALIAVGLSILVCTSEKAARFLTSRRASQPRLDRAMVWLEGKVPARLADAIGRTRPSAD